MAIKRTDVIKGVLEMYDDIDILRERISDLTIENENLRQEVRIQKQIIDEFEGVSVTATDCFSGVRQHIR